MKIISARATYSEKAEKLFGSRDSARETVKKLLVSRDNKTGSFVVRGSTIRTERSGAAAKKK